MEEKAYPWPSSDLDSEEMKLLWKERQRTGNPINKVLAEAVQKSLRENGNGILYIP